MRDSLNVCRPANSFRILRTGHDKSPSRPHCCRSEEKRIQFLLPVLAKRSEITERPFLAASFWKILLGINRTIERPCHGRAVLLFEQFQRRPASERQVNVV